MSESDVHAMLLRVEEAAGYVQSQLSVEPRLGIVLGSGLGAFADRLRGDVTRLSYGQIPHMPEPNVIGHSGELSAGLVEGFPAVVLRGRVHTYEGRTLEEAVFGVRMLASIGCESVLLTNAAGGINRALAPGSLMAITDHLNLTGSNPLVGPNYGVGPRFPDMTLAYDPDLRRLAREVASTAGIELHEGVYAGVLGPSYETPAEVRMLRQLGADAVGMSTVAETIALRQLGVRVGAVSCITNWAAGLSAGPLDHAEVNREAAKASDQFERFMSAWVREILG